MKPAGVWIGAGCALGGLVGLAIVVVAVLEDRARDSAGSSVGSGASVAASVPARLAARATTGDVTKVVRSREVLVPGSAWSSPLVVDVAHGYPTAIVFTDDAGEPWPVKRVVAPAVHLLEEGSANDASHILYMIPRDGQRGSSALVELAGLKLPVVLDFRAGGKAVDGRITARVQGERDLAAALTRAGGQGRAAGAGSAELAHATGRAGACDGSVATGDAAADAPTPLNDTGRRTGGFTAAEWLARNGGRG